jgi:type VI secretion system protein ImpK
MMVYLWFSHTISSASDHIYNQIFALPRDRTVPPPLDLRGVQGDPVERKPRVSPPPLQDKADRFRALLAAEIAQNKVAVLEGPILRISNAFPSGSDQILEDFRPILTKIALELGNDNSRVLVIGHTDDRPIKSFSARFKSNWDLSVARAKSVASMLETSAVLGDRLRFEGHADREPIAPNDMEKNQARNRRIDIHLR